MIKRGFTIIELLVVLVVMSILFTFGYANYRGYSRRQQFISSLRKIEGAVRTAQSLATSGVKGSNCDRLNGYQFSIDKESNTYSIRSSCVNNINTDVSEVLDSNINIANDMSVLFKVLGRGTDLAGPQVVTLTHLQTGQTGIITISASGNVSYTVD